MMRYDKMKVSTLTAYLRTRDAGALAYVRGCLAAKGGNISRAAVAMGVSRSTLGIWLSLPGLRTVGRLRPGRPKKEGAS